jgi:hypothetical protein
MKQSTLSLMEELNIISITRTEGERRRRRGREKAARINHVKRHLIYAKKPNIGA